MKRINLIIVFAVLFMFASCGKKDQKKVEDTAKSITEQVKDKAVEVADEAKEVVGSVASTLEGVPSFENKEVQAFVEKYNKVMDDYVEAIKEKSTTKVQSLITEVGQLGGEVNKYAEMLNGEDLEKFNKFIKSKVEAVQAVAKAAMK